MIFLGVPPSVANATNRLPILVGSSISVFNFHKSGDIVWSKTVLISIPVFLGTLTGSVLVKYFDAEYAQFLVFIAMIFSFILITTNSRSLLKGRSVINKKVTTKNHVIFFLIGVWAGLIVLDSAVLMLFELILGCGLDVSKANPIKNFLLLIVSLVSICVFYLQQLIHWEIGIMLSIGSFFGGYIGSKLSQHELIKIWIYRFLMGIVTFEICTLSIKLFFK